MNACLIVASSADLPEMKFALGLSARDAHQLLTGLTKGDNPGLWTAQADGSDIWISREVAECVRMVAELPQQQQPSGKIAIPQIVRG